MNLFVENQSENYSTLTWLSDEHFQIFFAALPQFFRETDKMPAAILKESLRDITVRVHPTNYFGEILLISIRLATTPALPMWSFLCEQMQRILQSWFSLFTLSFVVHSIYFFSLTYSSDVTLITLKTASRGAVKKEYPKLVIRPKGTMAHTLQAYSRRCRVEALMLL